MLVRPGRHGLVLHTLFYDHEIRSLDEFRTEVNWVSPRELELAAQVVESQATGFEPGKYRDRYCENPRALLDTKIRGEELRLEQSTPRLGPVPDMLEGLKASMARLRKAAAGTGQGSASSPTAVAR